MTIYSLDVLLLPSRFGTSLLFLSSSNCCFLTCIQISQETGQVVWYSHLFQNFPVCCGNNTVKGFGVVNKAEVDIFQEDLKTTTPYMMCTEWSVRNRRLEGYCQTPFKFSPRHIKKRKIGLPWCHSGKESACQYRRHKFNPWSRKSHMPRSNKAGIFILLQSNKAITTEPVLWSPGFATTEPACYIYWSPSALRAHVPQNEKPPTTMRSLDTATREKSTQQQRPSTAKNK